jgi:hypothetical protein
MTINNRKIDTRNKIELGGLVIKSKLDYLQGHNKDVILGALIDAYNKIQSQEGDHHFDYYKSLGKDAFDKSQNNNSSLSKNKNVLEKE